MHSPSFLRDNDHYMEAYLPFKAVLICLRTPRTALINVLTHWGRVTHTNIGSNNSLAPARCQAIIWNNAGSIGNCTLGNKLSEILIEIDTFSFKQMSSGKWRQFYLGLNVSGVNEWWG